MSVGVRSNRRRSREVAREEILDAAEGLLVECGPQKLKLVDVASRAGVGHSLIIHHFGSIAGLQHALAVRMSRQLVDEIATLIETAESTRPLISQIIARIFEIYGCPQNAKLIAWLALTGQEGDSSALAEQGRMLGALIKRKLVETGWGDLATAEFIAGLQALPMMAAVGEALGREVMAREILDDLPQDKIREWLAEFIGTKISRPD